MLRRMVIFASEDVGNADPQALAVAIAALRGVRAGRAARGRAAADPGRDVIWPRAPKSNTALTDLRGGARPTSTRTGALPVPPHLRNAPTPLMKSLGYGAGYQYPHDFEGHYVPEEYLPEALRGRRYYAPSDSGHERAIKERLLALRARAQREPK